MESLRKWARAQLKHIDKPEVEWDELRAIVAEAQSRAAREGLLEAVIACQGVRLRPTVDQMRRVLTVCVETRDVTPLTVRQAAKHAGVSPDTVREWIEAGQLKATKLTTFGRHPRYAIVPSALAKFMAKRNRC